MWIINLRLLISSNSNRYQNEIENKSYDFTDSVNDLFIWSGSLSHTNMNGTTDGLKTGVIKSNRPQRIRLKVSARKVYFLSYFVIFENLIVWLLEINEKSIKYIIYIIYWTWSTSVVIVKMSS